MTEADCRETVGLHNLDGIQVDSKCKLCWPSEAPDNAADGLVISSGSESSSSSSARSFHSEHGLEAALADESDQARGSRRQSEPVARVARERR